MTDRSKDAWRAHEERQRLGWLQLTYPQRLAWLEEAKAFVEKAERARKQSASRS